MKGIIKFVFILAISSLFLLSACGGGQPMDVTTPPNADHIVEFNEEGIAVLRGTMGGGGHSPTTHKETFNFLVPVNVDGVKTDISVPFLVRADTEISSTQIPQTMNATTYHSTHPNSLVIQAIPTSALAEVTFMKKGSVFEAISIHEVTKEFTLFENRPVIENVFSTDVDSQSMVVGRITGSITSDMIITWRVLTPIKTHDIEANVVLLIRSAPDTQVITSEGVVQYTSSFPVEHLEIKFTRIGNTLIARQITELP